MLILIVIDITLDDARKRCMLLEIIAGRREAYDNLMWQMPLLLLTGLSALLVVTLEETNHASCKRTAAALGMCISIGTYHSYVRLKFCEERDGKFIEETLTSRIGEGSAPPFAGRLFFNRNRAFENQTDLSPIFKLPFFQRKTHELWGYIEFCLIWTNFILFIATWINDIKNYETHWVVGGCIFFLVVDWCKFQYQEMTKKLVPRTAIAPKPLIQPSELKVVTRN